MVAAAAIAGVPLLNGFLSKEMFLAEALDRACSPLSALSRACHGGARAQRALFDPLHSPDVFGPPRPILTGCPGKHHSDACAGRRAGPAAWW